MLLVAVACSTADRSAEAGNKPGTVNVVIRDLSPVRIYATVVDAQGRQSGGRMNHLNSDIPGCLVRFPLDEGVAMDSAGAGRGRDVPVGCFFSIQRDWGAAPVLNKGGCELVLTSDQRGPARVTVIAMGSGLRDGRDSTSVMVEADKPSRLRLHWSTAHNQCVVKIDAGHVGR